MTQSIDQALVIQFSEMCHLRAQQMTSRLKGRVEEEYVRGNEFTYERLGNTRAIKITTRHADTIMNDINHDRRGGKMEEFRTTLPLDSFDALQVLIDPAKDYASAVARSMMIEYDRVCLEAALGTINTGRRLDTALTAVQDGVYTEPDNASGMTFDKVTNIRNRLYDSGVGLEFDEEINIYLTGRQHADLMHEYQFTSRDFTNASNATAIASTVIDKGRITNVEGMNVIILPAGPNIDSPLLQKTGNIRHCIVAAKSGIRVGMNKDITIEIDKRPDKNNLWQVQASMFMTAIRTEGVKVVQVDCLEA